MRTALMVSTVAMDLFAAGTAVLFAVVARGMPAAAYGVWAAVGVVLLAVTLLTLRVQRQLRRDAPAGAELPLSFLAASFALMAVTWLAMVAALVAIYVG
ncbi:MAG: hypothetical protein AB7Y46_21115 [Armatimonadota bacterium]